jgi:hypothetical protein
MEHRDICLAEFVSTGIFLAEECGKIIRKVNLSGELKTVNKLDQAGPVTLADLTA